MKKLLYLLFAVTLFAGCSSDDDNDAPKQEYTSFTVMQNEIDNQPNTVVGYKLEDGTYKKVAELGDLKKGIPSKEIKLNDNSITNIYIFSDYPAPTYKSDTVFILKKNIENSFQLTRYTKGIKVDKTSPEEYPQ